MSEKLIRLSNLSMTFEDGETILDGIESVHQQQRVPHIAGSQWMRKNYNATNYRWFSDAYVR